MDNQLEQKQLWSALSTLFVDTEVDYRGVAQIAKNYTLEEIEFALFERVAPVCVGNMLSPAPSIWWNFNEEQLIADIEALVKKRSEHGIVGKWVSAARGRLIRVISSSVWAQLKLEIERANNDG